MEHATRHTIKVDHETQSLLRLIAAHTGDKQYAVLARLVRDEWQRVQFHRPTVSGDEARVAGYRG